MSLGASTSRGGRATTGGVLVRAAEGLHFMVPFHGTPAVLRTRVPVEYDETPDTATGRPQPKPETPDGSGDSCGRGGYRGGVEREPEAGGSNGGAGAFTSLVRSVLCELLRWVGRLVGVCMGECWPYLKVQSLSSLKTTHARTHTHTHTRTHVRTHTHARTQHTCTRSRAPRPQQPGRKPTPPRD